MRNIVRLRNFDSNPLQLLNEINSDLKRIFDGFPLRHSECDFIPSYEMTETDSHYFVSFDVPGIPKNDIKVEVLEGQLRISGERKNMLEGDHYTEKKYGQFERILKLPQNAKEDGIEANFENGVLTIALTKVGPSIPKKIEISENRREGIWNRLFGNNEIEKKVV